MRNSQRRRAASIAWALAVALSIGACGNGGTSGGTRAGATTGTGSETAGTGTGDTGSSGATGTTGDTSGTGSTGSGTGGATGSSAILQALSVSPVSAVVPVSGSQAFTASATYSDGSRQDVSASATWTVGDAAIATVSTSGVVTGRSAGAVTVSASFNGISASATVTVKNATLTAIAITPTTVTAPAGVNVPLTATGLYSDHTSRDVTSQVTWTTGDASVATITAAGLLSATAAGNTLVTATAAAVSATVPVSVTPATLQSLAVSPGALSLPAGVSDRLSATGTFSDTTARDVTTQVSWTSSDATVVTVDATGRVTARAVGSATVSGSLGGRSVTVAVDVTSATLVAVQITPDLPSVPAGVEIAFTLTGIFSDQTTRDLSGAATWTVADPSVATLSGSGVAAGLQPGTTTVTATVGAASGSTTLTVTPATLVAVDVLPPVSSIALGTEAFLQAMATYSDGSVVDVTSQALWSSDSAAVAVSVDARGAVATGLAVGSANVTAAFGDASDVATVTVTAASLRSIAVSPSSSTLPIGLTQPLLATGTFSDQTTQDVSNEVTWTSSDPATATVSTGGVVTALRAGTATVTATLLGVSATSTVTVSSVALQSLAVTPTVTKLAKGYKVQFRAVAGYSDGSTHDVTSQALWSTSNGSIVAISNASNSKGLATGVAAGAATVTATLGTISASGTVQVTTARLASLLVSPASFAATTKTTVQLTATGTFDDGSTLDLTRQCSWSSSGKRIARVSQSGLVTAAKRGTVTITATKSGLSGSANGTVN